MRQVVSAETNTLHLFMTRYKLEKWWKIKDLKENKVFYSEQIPLRMVPCFSALSIPHGHTPAHEEVVVEVENARVELHTGTLWYHNKIVSQVEKADRVLLFKRVVRGSDTQILKTKYFIGLANNKTKFGVVIIINTDSSDIIVKNIRTDEEING